MAGYARVLGPGPVFVYEWITAARRWQRYALRSMFVLGLLVAMLVVARAPGGPGVVGVRSSLSAMAAVGERLFLGVVGTQLTLVLLAAPAATAGAICLDRSRGGLSHLLATDLTDAEIVLGKLAARMAPVLTLVAATLPFLELLTLLGGVDPDALFGAFVVTLGIAALGCTLALVFSMWVSRVHEAMLATYAVWGVWLLGRPMLVQINRAAGWSLPEPPLAADPFWLAFAPYWRPGSVGWGDYLGFLAVTWGISAVLALCAVRTLRRACLRESAWRAPRRSRRWVPNLAIEIYRKTGPSLDFNPVLWREWHRNRPTRWARVVAGGFVVVAIVYSAMAICLGGSTMMAPWVNGLQVSVGFLFLSVIAATSLAEERMRGSLDVLMTTPMETRAIVFGKWLGTFRLVPPMAILPVLVVLGTGRSPDLRLGGALLMIAFVLSAGAAITSLGLAMATWCTRLGRAVGLTVSVYLLVTVGWMFAVMGALPMPQAERLMMGSPFFWPGEFTHELVNGGARLYMGAALGWIVCYGVAAFVLLAATLTTFDRFLGRMQDAEWLLQGRMSSTAIRPTSAPSITTGRRWPGARTSSASYPAGPGRE